MQLMPRKQAAWLRLLAHILYSSNVLAYYFIFLVKSYNSIINLSFLLIADVVDVMLMVYHYSFILLTWRTP